MVRYLADAVMPGKFWVEYVASQALITDFADHCPASSLCVCLADACECQLSDTFPVRFVPSWMPGAGFKRFAAEVKTANDPFVVRPWHVSGSP
jgi:hypothetical protein